MGFFFFKSTVYPSRLFTTSDRPPHPTSSPFCYLKFLGDSRHKRGHWVLSSCGLHALKRWFHEKKEERSQTFFSRELEVRLVMQVEAFFSLLRSPRLATICATRKECIACTQGSTRQWRDSSYSRSRVDEKCTVEPINSFRRWVQKKQRNTKLAIFRRKCQNCMSNFERGGEGDEKERAHCLSRSLKKSWERQCG